jgi:hypothetical protein
VLEENFNEAIDKSLSQIIEILKESEIIEEKINLVEGLELKKTLGEFNLPAYTWRLKPSSPASGKLAIVALEVCLNQLDKIKGAKEVTINFAELFSQVRPRYGQRANEKSPTYLDERVVPRLEELFKEPVEVNAVPEVVITGKLKGEVPEGLNVSPYTEITIVRK